MPTDKKEREQTLKELEQETRTIILYEAPHRLVKTLTLLADRLGDREVTVCRELTKRYETAFRTTLTEAIRFYESTPVKGECVLVLEGKKWADIEQEEQEKWEQLSIEEHMALYLTQGIEKKAAMKKVAADRRVSKREIYNYLER